MRIQKIVSDLREEGLLLPLMEFGVCVYVNVVRESDEIWINVRKFPLILFNNVEDYLEKLFECDCRQSNDFQLQQIFIKEISYSLIPSSIREKFLANIDRSLSPGKFEIL